MSTIYCDRCRAFDNGGESPASVNVGRYTLKGREINLCDRCEEITSKSHTLGVAAAGERPRGRARRRRGNDLPAGWRHTGGGWYVNDETGAKQHGRPEA